MPRDILAYQPGPKTVGVGIALAYKALPSEVRSADVAGAVAEGTAGACARDGSTAASHDAVRPTCNGTTAAAGDNSTGAGCNGTPFGARHRTVIPGHSAGFAARRVNVAIRPDHDGASLLPAAVLPPGPVTAPALPPVTTVVPRRPVQTLPPNRRSQCRRRAR